MKSYGDEVSVNVKIYIMDPTPKLIFKIVLELNAPLRVNQNLDWAYILIFSPFESVVLRP